MPRLKFQTLTALTVGVSGWMKRKGVSAAVNRLTVIVIGIGFTIVMTQGMFLMVIRGNFSDGGYSETYEYNGRTYEAGCDELPLTVEDLSQGEFDGNPRGLYSYELTEKESFVLARIEARQMPRRDAGNLPGMRYTVTKIKMPFLYDWCLRAVKDNYFYSQEYNGEASYHELRGMDAAPWGADEAYRVYWDDEAEKEYVICYGDVIVEVNTEWELTEGQMGIVGEKF